MVLFLYLVIVYVQTPFLLFYLTLSGTSYVRITVQTRSPYDKLVNALFLRLGTTLTFVMVWRLLHDLRRLCVRVGVSS